MRHVSSGPRPWTKHVLDRRVPASGVINVTLALTGLGAVYFDDVRIEPLVWTPGANPDTTFATLSWRFLRQWSAQTTVGDAGTSILDFVWKHRY